MNNDEKAEEVEEVETSKPKVEKSPSKENRRKEKRKELLHDDEKTQVLIKENKTQRASRKYKEHRDEVGNQIIDMAQGLQLYYDFEFITIVDEMDTIINNIAYTDGNEREQLLGMIDKFIRHVGEVLEDTSAVNTQIRAMVDLLDSQYPENKNIIDRVIGVPKSIADKSLRILTLGKLKLKTEREIK